MRYQSLKKVLFLCAAVMAVNPMDYAFAAATPNNPNIEIEVNENHPFVRSLGFSWRPTIKVKEGKEEVTKFGDYETAKSLQTIGYAPHHSPIQWQLDVKNE